MGTRSKTVRLREDLYERLRRASFDQRVSQNSIIEEALDAHLRRLESQGKVVAHKDGDPRNNDPANLEIRDA